MLDNARYCALCGSALSQERIDGRDRPRCGACGWVWWGHARPVVLVLAVTPTGKVVLTRDSRFPPDRWGLVAGYIERGENAEQAALRELAEEAGLEGRRPRVVGTDAAGENVMVCVLCHIEDADIATSGHSEVERSMGTEVQLVTPGLARIVSDSPASRLVERLISGQLWRGLSASSGERTGRVALLNAAPSLPAASGDATHALGAASVIVDASTHVLLVRHTYGRRNWEIPGGISEAGESAEETARREVRQEVGVEIEIDALTGVYWEPEWREVGGHHFVFRARLVSGAQPRAADANEIADIGWFSPDAPPRPISDFTTQRIRDALSRGPAVVHTVGSRRWLE